MATKKSSSSDGKYTKPELRERIKEKLKKSDKGAKPGQWSARKSQMLASEYKEKGGGYTSSPDKSQKNLSKWTDEEWTTQDKKTARRGKTTARYLPKKAWESMTPSERKETEQKKTSGSRTGRQYVDNTSAAKASRKKASGGSKKKATTARKKKAGGRKNAVGKKKAGRKKASATGRKKTARKTSTRKASANKKVGRKTSGRKATSRKATGRGKKKSRTSRT